jgi:hypothetical protein
VVAQWPLPLGLNTNNPFANSLDDSNRRLFVAYQGDTTHSPFFVVHNTLDGSVVWAMQTTQKCDQIKRHPTNGLIFVICGGSAPPVDGSTIYLIQQKSANSYTLLDTELPLSGGLYLARTGYFDAAASNLYVSVPANTANTPPQAAQLLVYSVTAPLAASSAATPTPCPAASPLATPPVTTSSTGSASCDPKLINTAAASIISAALIVLVASFLQLAGPEFVQRVLHRVGCAGKKRNMAAKSGPLVSSRKADAAKQVEAPTQAYAADSKHLAEAVEKTNPAQIAHPSSAMAPFARPAVSSTAPADAKPAVAVVVATSTTTAASSAPLPSGWSVEKDENDDEYFVNAMTGESQWERPD